MKDSRMNCQKGATLIELIIMLSLAAVIAGVASLSLMSVEKRKLQNAALELQSALRHAQRLSMAENVSYQVSFNLANRSCKIINVSVRPEKTIHTVTLDPSVTIYSADMSGGRYVTFTPKGTTSSAGTIKLRTTNYSLNMTVNIGAGKVTVKDIEKLKK